MCLLKKTVPVPCLGLFQLSHLVLDSPQLVSGCLGLGVGLGQGDTLGLHSTVHLVVPHDVHSPGAETLNEIG